MLAYDKGGFYNTKLGGALNDVGEWIGKETYTAINGDASQTDTAKFLNNAAGFVKYLTTERSLAETVQGATDFTKNVATSVENWWNSNNGLQKTEQITHFLGGEAIPFVLTAGAGTVEKVGSEIAVSSVRLAEEVSVARQAEALSAAAGGLEGSGVSTFYHGTTAEFASAIRANGIDLAAGNPAADFGRGFYMTTSREEALLSGGRNYAGPLDVVEFNVPNHELGKLSSLEFQSANSSWQDFVGFHKTYAPEDLLHGGQPYDLVSGPLFRTYSGAGDAVPWPNRLPQTSIHTPIAVDLFNAYMKK